jgi:hypothetical protein
VATFFLALAALATMGFSVSHDVATCELAPVELTAIELLDYLDDPCYADLVDQVEIEIGWGFSGTGPDPALLEWFNARNNASASGSVEYLAIIEAEDEWDYRPSATSSARSSSSSAELDEYLAFIEAEEEWVYGPSATPSADSGSSGSAFRAYLDYIEVEEEWLDGPPNN